MVSNEKGQQFMTGRLSVQLECSVFDQLDGQSRRIGKSRSWLARTLIEEGLRMAVYPGIVFRPGPAGRRPGLARGPDIWEIARMMRELEEHGPSWVDEVAEYTLLSRHEVLTAYRYYVAYRDEIDADIRRREEHAEQARAAWMRERGLDPAEDNSETCHARN